MINVLYSILTVVHILCLPSCYNGNRNPLLSFFQTPCNYVKDSLYCILKKYDKSFLLNTVGCWINNYLFSPVFNNYESIISQNNNLHWKFQIETNSNVVQDDGYNCGIIFLEIIEHILTGNDMKDWQNSDISEKQKYREYIKSLIVEHNSSNVTLINAQKTMCSKSNPVLLSKPMDLTVDELF